MVESNRDDYSIVLVEQDIAEVTSGTLKGVTIDRRELEHWFPGIKTGNQLIIANEILNVIIGE